jgi:membrane peptidoglycan carboxypeptidase
MRLRGKLTLLCLAAIAGFAGERVLSIWRPVLAARATAGPTAAVSLPAPEAPAQILGRLPVTRDHLEALAPQTDSQAQRYLSESVPVPEADSRLRGPLQIDYTLDAQLSHEIFRILKKGRVALGHVIVLDPETGRLMAYVSTDAERFPAERTYPAASLVKVVTTAAALHHAPEVAEESCRYVGNPYRLTRSRLDPPRRGHSVSLRRALATSNNQCFAQLTVHRLGSSVLLDALERFGWLEAPAPVHSAGEVQAGEDPLDLGKLGCGLAGCRITPLHAAQLAAILADGKRVEPYWIARVRDGGGRSLRLPRRSPPRQVLTPELAEQLREMLVDTTLRGTARKAFRTRRGRPLLDPVRVAGKTGSLSGRDPDGRYEWFVGVAPADEPRLAVAVVLVQGKLWWLTPSQVAAEVLRVAFCPKGVCRPEAAQRWLERDIAASSAGSGQPLEKAESRRGSPQG